MIRVAAVGDIHLGDDDRGVFSAALDELSGCADMLLLAGDLTRRGTRSEADVVAAELKALDVPVVAVLGNHDHHSDQSEAVIGSLEAVGVEVLEGSGTTVDVRGVRVGVAGAKGFGGGFGHGLCADFGDPETKHLAASARRSAEALAGALDQVRDADVRIALTHYAPVIDTLAGEPPEIFPFLGNSLLAGAIDAHRAHLAVHGHAHKGARNGATAGGVPVRNVARPLLDHDYVVLDVDEDGMLLGQQRMEGVAGTSGRETGVIRPHVEAP